MQGAGAAPWTGTAPFVIHDQYLAAGPAAQGTR
jgi:hypothetical protein